jgi:hypothetical protein
VAVVVAATSTAIVATAVAFVVAAAPFLGRVGRVLLVRRDLRLIRALEPGTLDEPDVRPHLGGYPLEVVRVIGRRREGGSVDRRPLGPGGNLLLWVLRVTEVLHWRTWFALPLVAGATWRTSTLFILAHGQMEEKRELEEKQQMIEG